MIVTKHEFLFDVCQKCGTSAFSADESCQPQHSEQQEWAKAYGPNDDCLQIEGMAFQVNTSAKAVADKINAALAAAYSEGNTSAFESKYVRGLETELAAERQRREQAEVDRHERGLSLVALRQQLLSARTAIEKIKRSVCGDKRPNWKDDWTTTQTRMWIADVCDSVDLSNEKQTKCPECKGTGLDKEHKWPDGSFAYCEACDGYGYLEAPHSELGGSLEGIEPEAHIGE